MSNDRYYCKPHEVWHANTEFGGYYCIEYIHHICRYDLIKYGKIFFPGDFVKQNETPRFHHVVGKSLIKTQPRSRIANIIPRGMAKSMLKKTALMHKMSFNPPDRIEFVPWVCETQYQAIKHVRWIKDQIEFNTTLQHYFPGIKPGKKWTEKDFETISGDKIFAIGMEQKLRGGNHFVARLGRSFRYTGVILDDFEGEHNTLSVDARNKNRRLIAGSVLPALEESPGHEGWIWLSGTIVHYDSFLQGIYDGWKAEEEKGLEHVWDLHFYTATHNKRLDDDSLPLWPSRFSVEKLRKMKAEMESTGALASFAQEMMNDARDEETAPFKISKIRDHYGELKVVGNQAYLIFGGFDDKGTAYRGDKVAIPVYIYMGVDPAQTVSKRSDFSVILIMAIDSQQRRYVLDIYRERVPGFELKDEIVRMGTRWRPIAKINIDPTGGSEMVADLYNRVSKEERKMLPGITRSDVSYSGTELKKVERNTSALAHIVNDGLLYMRPEQKHLLADEMWEMPSPKYDDTIDGMFLANYTARKRFPRISSMDAKDIPAEKDRKKRRAIKKDWRNQSVWGKGNWLGR